MFSSEEEELLPGGRAPSEGKLKVGRMTKQAEKRVYETSGLGIACDGISFFGGRRQDADLHKSTQGCGTRSTTMKKLMIAATAALWATVGLADVTSANVVGYQTTGFDKSGWMMNVGVAFSNVGAADGAFTLDDKFFGGAAAEGDQIITLDAEAWDLNTYDKLGAGEGWMLTPPGGTGSELLPSIKASKGDLPC